MVQKVMSRPATNDKSEKYWNNTGNTGNTMLEIHYWKYWNKTESKKLTPATYERSEKYWNNTALVIDCPASPQLVATADGAIKTSFYPKYLFHLTPSFCSLGGHWLGCKHAPSFYVVSSSKQAGASKARRTHGTEYRIGSCVSAQVKATVEGFWSIKGYVLTLRYLSEQHNTIQTTDIFWVSVTHSYSILSSSNSDHHLQFAKGPKRARCWGVSAAKLFNFGLIVNFLTATDAICKASTMS